jgi:hypothetical protein
MGYPSDGKIGIDLSTIGSSALFGLGEVSSGTDGSRWVYACAEGSTNKGACVLVRPSGLATQVAFALLSNRGGQFAFAMTLLAASQYSWYQNAGTNVIIRIGSANPGAQLFTSDTPGVLDGAIDTLSQYLILGVQNAPTTATGTTAMPSCSAAFPHFIRYEN